MSRTPAAPEFPPVDPYDFFAACYDDIMRTIDYGAWAAAIDRYLGRYRVPGPRVLDVGCGTGTMALNLAAYGWETAGLDRSPSMLAQARAKVKQAGLDIRFHQADLRDFPLSERCDAVLSLHDSVNYLMDDGEIRAFLASALAALVPGGLLVFDLATPRNIVRNFRGHVFCENRAGYSYVWRNAYSRWTRVAVAEFEFLLRDGTAHRFASERHVQRIHLPRRVKALVRGAGFELLAAHDGFTDRPAHRGSEGVTFVARNPVVAGAARAYTL